MAGEHARKADNRTLSQKGRGYFVHFYTASGMIFAFLAAAETCRAEPDARMVFVWLLVAVLIDATDGPLARLWHVHAWAPAIEGRKIDDILDYLTFTFVPLLLGWRMGWFAPPAGLWVVAAMIASVLGFASVDAKQEAQGFFRGFPSYWNIFVFYAGLWYAYYGPVPATILLVVLTVLTVLPVRFVYPNLAPRPWRWPVLLGAAVWLAILLLMLASYPQVAPGVMWISLIYPAFYVGVSVYLDGKARRA
jgi:phosphatidylcholine synthase